MHQRSHRIGPLPAKAAAVFFTQRFGQNKITIQPVQQRQNSGCNKRNAGSHTTQQTTDYRANNKTQSKGGADHSKIFGPVCRRTNISYISRGCCKAGACYACNNSAHKQPADSRRQGQQYIINAKTKKREQQYQSMNKPSRGIQILAYEHLLI